MSNMNVIPMRPKQTMKVVIDGWNMLSCYSNLRADRGRSNNYRDIDPAVIGDAIAAMRKGPHGQQTRCDAIEIHIGVIDEREDPSRHRYEMEMIECWRKDRRVKVHVRTLRRKYGQDAYEEKSVDMAAGIATYKAVRDSSYDVVVLFTGDWDFESVLEEAHSEYLAKRTRTRTEIARWEGQGGVKLTDDKVMWRHSVSLDIVAPRTYTLEAA